MSKIIEELENAQLKKMCRISRLAIPWLCKLES